MELLPKEIAEKLPAMYSQEKVEDPLAMVKFFTPDSGWTWWATEYDPEERLFFGLVEGFEVELGCFSLDELQSVRGPIGLPIERDIDFKPTPLSEIRAAIRRR